MWQHERILALGEEFQKKAVEVLHERGQVPPMVMLFGRRNPETKQEGPIHVFFEWHGAFGDAASKNAWALQVRAVSALCNAVGIAYVSEVSVVEGDVPVEDIEKHPDKKDALHMCFHFLPSVGIPPSGMLAIIDRKDGAVTAIQSWVKGPPKAVDQVDFATLLPAD